MVSLTWFQKFYNWFFFSILATTTKTFSIDDKLKAGRKTQQPVQNQFKITKGQNIFKAQIGANKS